MWIADLFSNFSLLIFLVLWPKSADLINGMVDHADTVIACIWFRDVFFEETTTWLAESTKKFQLRLIESMNGSPLAFLAPFPVLASQTLLDDASSSRHNTLEKFARTTVQ